MNMHIKGHQMTRKISGIRGSRDGQILISFEPHAPFDCEYLLFFADELHVTTKEIILIGAIENGDGPFAEIPGDSAGFTSGGPEISKDNSFINPLRNNKKG